MRRRSAKNATMHSLSPRIAPAAALVTLAFASTVALTACPSARTAVVENEVATVTVQLEPFSLQVTNSEGKVILQSSDADGRLGALVAATDRWSTKLALSPGWDDYVEEPGTWHHFTRAKVLARSDTILDLEIAGDSDAPARVLVELEGQRVHVRAVVAGEHTGLENQLSFGFVMPDDARVFGGGERFGPLNHRRQCLYAWSEEGGLGLGEDTPASIRNPAPNGVSMTYFPVPFFHVRTESSGYGLFLNTTLRTTACFGADRDDVMRTTVNGDALELVVYVDDDPLKVLDLYTEDSGRPFEPAPWVWGPRRRVSPNAKVAAYDNAPEIELLRRFHVPTTGVDDAVHLLPARSELGREDELRAWINDAHSWGYKVMAYNNPYISTSIATASDDLAFGIANDLFLKDDQGNIGEVFFVSGTSQTLATIDLTNPDGVLFFQNLLRRSLALGYDGWMHDFGEYVRRGWTSHSGDVGEVLHNRFPVLSAKAAHDLLVEERPDDFLFFVRSGYAGTQAFVPAVWGGDAEATFDETQGIPSAFHSGLNLSLSGVPYWGSDTTGFKCLTDAPKDKEVYLRWAQLSATSPIFMEQNACVGIGRGTKWSLWNDEETIEVYAAQARLHTRLQPYFRQLARDAHATGAPLLRAPFFAAPFDARSLDVDDAWFLGDALYVAPVLKRGQIARPVYFPPGHRYLDLRDNTLHDGGTEATVDAPLQELPLFLVEGVLLPLLDNEVETLAESSREDVVDAFDRADVLDVAVALKDGAEATTTLKDGTVIHVARDGAEDTAGLQPLTDLKQGARQFEASEARGRPLRLRGDKARTTKVSAAGVTLEVDGPVERLVRLTVFRLP